MIIFYCLTSFCNVKFFKYFSLYYRFLRHFLSLSKSYISKDLFCFLMKWSVLSASWILIMKKNILMYYVKGVCTKEYSWRLILFLNTCYTSSILLCMDMFIYSIWNADIFSGVHFFWCHSFTLFKQSKSSHLVK